MPGFPLRFELSEPVDCVVREVIALEYTLEDRDAFDGVRITAIPEHVVSRSGNRENVQNVINTDTGFLVE
ncbi:hypothetical protein D3C75_1175820 [compost metagenome]